MGFHREDLHRDAFLLEDLLDVIGDRFSPPGGSVVSIFRIAWKWRIVSSSSFAQSGCAVLRAERRGT